MYEFYNGWLMEKIFTELRFAPTPLFFDRKQDVFQKLLPGLPSYNIQNIDTISMHSKDVPGIDFSLSPNRFCYTFENPKQNDSFAESCKDKWAIVNGRLNISTIDRFGLRAIFIKPMDLKEASTHTKRFIDLSKIRYSINLDAIDCVYYFKELDKSIKIAVSTGEIKTLELSNANQQNMVRQVSGLIADIDFSYENFQSKFVPNLFEEGVDKLKKYLAIFD